MGDLLSSSSVSRRARSSPGFLTAALLAVAAPACSLLFATDLDGARGAADPDAEAAEAAADAPTDGERDDVAPRDGGDGGDADAGSRGCASYDPAPDFCEDFDDGPLARGWTKLQEQSGTLAFDPLAYSPPRSGRANLNDAPSCSYTRFERSISGVGSKRVEVRAQLRPTGPWSRTFTLFTVHIRSCAVLFYVHPNGAGAIDSSSINIQSGDPLTNDERDVKGGPRLNEWTDLWFEAVPNATSGSSLTISFHHEDGSVEETTVNAPQCRVGGDLFVAPGFHCEDGTGEVRYDDVRAYWE